MTRYEKRQLCSMAIEAVCKRTYYKYTDEVPTWVKHMLEQEYGVLRVVYRLNPDIEYKARTFVNTFFHAKKAIYGDDLYKIIAALRFDFYKEHPEYQ